MLRISKTELNKLSPPVTPKSKPVKKGVQRNPRMKGTEEYREILMHMDIAPRPKERARTYADKNVLLSAFRAAHGNAAKFMSMVMAGLMKTVTPESTRIYEKAISSAAEAYMSREGIVPFSVPVFMSAVFIFCGTGNEWPTGHSDGDLDNLEKALLDGLNGIAWTDDRLVSGKISYKTTGTQAGIMVRIWPAPPLLPEKLTFTTNGLPASFSSADKR